MSIAVNLLVIVCLLAFPQRCAAAAREALRVWALDVVPSLFPYMVFCRLLSRRMKGTRLPAAPIAAALGALGGSPAGAAVIAGFGDRLSRRARLALCALTGIVSPMFLLGTMERWTQDAVLCRLLLISQLLGACFAAACAYACSGGDTGARACPPSAQASPVAQSVDAILQVGGCIVCYSVLASLLTLAPGMDGIWGAALHAALEISGGAHAMIAVTAPGALQSVTLAALLSFSGLSILTQNHALLAPMGVGRRTLITFALLRALGAALCMALLFPLF